jgi:CRP/FNR family transcriptional regulator, cyclic AMP receptor protein
MNPSDVRALHHRRGAVLAPAGTILFDPDHPSRRMYQVKSGLVQLSSDSETIIDHLGPGSFFGEKFLLSRPRSGQIAEAVSPSRVESFGRDKLLTRVQRDHRFAVQLLRNLAHRIDRNEQTIRDFAKEPAARRLVLFLSRMLPPRSPGGWVRLPWNPTNPELARRIGTTRWRISRLLNQFQRLGWLRRENGLWVRREGLDGFLYTPK